MKFKNTMSYFYTNVKGLLEEVEVPNDDIFGKVKDGILSKIDSQLCSGQVTIVNENVVPMLKVLQDQDYPYRNKIYAPEKIAKMNELAIHLSIFKSIYDGESNIPDENKDVKYERLPNPNLVIKNGVMSQYEEKLNLPERLPNL